MRQPLADLPDFEHDLIQREQAGLLRSRRVHHGSAGPLVRYQGRPCLNFCSNDYLGLAADPRLQSALCAAARAHGIGAGGSQLVSGYHGVHQDLETRLAEFTGRERALLFGSGYLANLGVVTALTRADSTVVLDRLVHASLIDAVLLSRSRFRRYTHNDPSALRAGLAATSARHKLVLTEGVFSMEGDIAPLAELAAVCHESGALLLVDDAHGFGVLGAAGAGSVAQAGLDSDMAPLLMATFGKALGGYGAFIAGPARLLEHILQHARSLIYSTAPPPALAAATLRALEIAGREHWRREKLAGLVDHWRAGAAARGIRLLPSPTPIQPVLIGSNDKALQVSKQLLSKNILVPAIRPPTVPAGTARLRVSLTAAHQPTQLDRLLDALAETA